MKNRFLVRLIWLTLVAVLLIQVWQGGFSFFSLFGGNQGAAPRVVTARGDLAADEKTTIELFEKARDSVVFISTKGEVLDFWTRNVRSVPRGTGSGFIWDDEGHVVTNFHVIDGASEAVVKLADGRSFRAALVGASKSHDIAVLKIGVGFRRPPPVPVGTSSDLKVGQKVFAIGNPFGLDWTLTTGIVSALDRSLNEENGASVDHLIQTDAAINPGNSGGPLLDSAGRLIGITTAIYSPSGANAGIGFAVPVDTVNRVVPHLISQGRYLRPGLGIPLNDALNERLKRAIGVEGVVVLDVGSGSAAEAAGLRPAKRSSSGEIVLGDTIVAVEGKPVATCQILQSRLDDYKVGDTIRVTILRAGKTIQISATLQPEP
ncbi:MAG: trypsin-like peptidase domain-containing protein [Betaproteobacteria bacterium]|nr:trypsin-like peptidase domain-containing protein [Betaproteobacteria bacterium]